MRQNQGVFHPGTYLISLGPFDLGPEVLDTLVETPVAAQVGLHGGQVGPPLGLVDAALVLLHPGQEVLGVAQRDTVQLRSPLGGMDNLGWLMHGGRRGGALLTQVVIGAQVHQALMEAVDPAGMGTS